MRGAAESDHSWVAAEPAIERDDVLAIMGALLDVHWKLDRILELLGDDEAEAT